jgi:restriction system protein
MTLVKQLTRLAKLQPQTQSQGLHRIEVRHDGLNKFRVITGKWAHEVEQKAQVQAAAWNAAWARRVEKEERWASALWRLRAKEAKKDEAAALTREAQNAVAECESVLVAGLKKARPFIWEHMKARGEFSQVKPIPPSFPAFREEPRPEQFQTKIGFFSSLIPFRRRRIENEDRKTFEARHAAWKFQFDKTRVKYEQEMAAYEREFSEWNQRKTAFEDDKNRQNTSIDAFQSRYLERDPTSIIEYCGLILSNSLYPDNFQGDWAIDFKIDTGILVVDYRLPSRSDMPTLKEVKYVASRDEFDEIGLKDSVINSLYDSVIYQICLRTIHELLAADEIDVINSVVFNGWVIYISQATGQEVRACIMSLHVKAEDFRNLNLASVDPKACFRGLKGVASSQLHAMAPVQPILQLDRADHRFGQLSP